MNIDAENFEDHLIYTEDAEESTYSIGQNGFVYSNEYLELYYSDFNYDDYWLERDDDYSDRYLYLLDDEDFHDAKEYLEPFTLEREYDDHSIYLDDSMSIEETNKEEQTQRLKNAYCMNDDNTLRIHLIQTESQSLPLSISMQYNPKDEGKCIKEWILPYCIQNSMPFTARYCIRLLFNKYKNITDKDMEALKTVNILARPVDQRRNLRAILSEVSFQCAKQQRETALSISEMALFGKNPYLPTDVQRVIMGFLYGDKNKDKHKHIFERYCME